MRKKYQVQVVSVVLITGIALALAGSAYFWGIPLIEKSKSNVEITEAKQFMDNLISNIEEVASTGNTKTMMVDIKGVLSVDSASDTIDYTISSGIPSYANTMFVPLNDNLPYKKKVYVGEVGSNVVVKECSPPSGECIASYDDITNKIKFSGVCVNGISGKEFSSGEKVVCKGEGEDNFIVHLENLQDYGFWFLEGENEEKVFGVEGVNKPLVLMAKSIPSPTGDRYTNIFRIYSREVDDPNTHDGKYYDIEATGQVKASGQVKITISRGDGELIPGGSELGGDLSKIKIEILIQ